jgi:hypothetical protein
VNQTYYRPYGHEWQVMEPGPYGVLIPGKTYPTPEALLKDHPGARFEHPEPVLPLDLQVPG